METKVTSLSKDDLINLFATATYGSEAIEVTIHPHSKKLAIGDNKDEKIANVLLKGGDIEITDLYSEEPKGNADHYGSNHIFVHWKAFEVDKHFSEEQGKWGHMVYTINMQNILRGINKSQAAKDYAHTLFETKDGDYYTAYNLIQLIVFGEEVYG